MIERAHDDPERSFLPGRIFCSPVDFNTQLADWLAVGIEIIWPGVSAVCDGKLVADHERIWGWHRTICHVDTELVRPASKDA